MFVHKRIWLYVLGLVWVINLLAPLPVKADKLSADLKICVQTEDGKLIRNASVVLKGGKNDVKLTTDTAGCYRNKGISFDTTKEYSIDIQAEGYRPTTHAVDISKIKPDSEVSLDPVVLVLNGPPLGATPAAESLAAATPDSNPKTAITPTASQFAISIGALLIIALVGLAIFWRHSKRLSRVGSVLSEIQNTLRSIADSNQNISPYVDNIKASLAHIDQINEKKIEVLTGIREVLQRIAVLGPPDDTGHENISSTTPPPAVVPSPAIPELSNKERSIIAYERFLNGETVSPEPLRLSDAGGSSADDLLGGRGVLLEENLQGALLLLRIQETDPRGWVYPDLKWKYRGPELTSVFPKMTIEQYDCLKTQRTLNGCGFEPVAVELDSITQKWKLEVASKV